MTAAEELAKLFANELEDRAEATGDFFVDHGEGKVAFDGIIDLNALAEIALGFDPEDYHEPVDFTCPECGGHNRHTDFCIRGRSPVDTGALKRSITVRKGD